MTEHHYATPGHHFTADDERLIKDLSRHGTEQAMQAVARAASLAPDKQQMSVVISAVCSAFLGTVKPLRKLNPEVRTAIDAMIKQILRELDYHEI